MQSADSFIVDSLLFNECKAELSRYCCIEKHLPEKVFGEKLNHFTFEEFDWAMSEEFWDTLQALAHKSRDQSLLVGVLDPDPVDYYKKEFGFYNWALIHSSSTSENYWKLLNQHPEESPADSILSNSQKVVWAARSGAWVVWGERSLGICILACSDINIVKSTFWRDIDWALENILPDCFREGNVSAEFIKQFRENYDFGSWRV